LRERPNLVLIQQFLFDRFGQRRGGESWIHD
jgi:hypothetical protein